MVAVPDDACFALCLFLAEVTSQNPESTYEALEMYLGPCLNFG